MYKLKTLHIYIIKEFTSSFLFAIAVFSVLLLLDRIFDLVALFLSKGISVFTIIKLFILIYPNILPLAVPMAVLFGILLSYGTLSENNEITALRANGCDYKTLYSPLLSIAACFSFVLIIFNSFIIPVSQTKMQSLFTEILIQAPLISFAPKTTINIGGYSLYANSASKDGKNLSGISIYKFIDEKKTISKSSSSTNASSNIKDNEVSWRITASSASIKLYKTGIALTLHNGYWQKNVTHNLNNMIHMTFNSYSFFISLADKNKSTTKSTSAQELNSIQLLKTIKTNKKLKRSYTAYSIEFFSRLLFATAPLIFAFIAIPIGLTGNKNSKAMGFLISLIILLGYYMLLIMSINIAEKGLLPAGIIMWAPNLVLLLCGSYLFSKMVKK